MTKTYEKRIRGIKKRVNTMTFSFDERDYQFLTKTAQREGFAKVTTLVRRIIAFYILDHQQRIKCEVCGQGDELIEQRCVVCGRRIKEVAQNEDNSKL